MRRGDIYLVDLQPTRGSESNKIRPAVVVSNDAANRAATRAARTIVTIVPLTSNIERVYPFQVLIEPGGSGLSMASKAQAEQVRAMAAERLGRRLGSLSEADLGRLDNALRIHLAL